MEFDWPHDKDVVILELRATEQDLAATLKLKKEAEELLEGDFSPAELKQLRADIAECEQLIQDFTAMVAEYQDILANWDDRFTEKVRGQA